jgi:hypothetical protein
VLGAGLGVAVVVLRRWSVDGSHVEDEAFDADALAAVREEAERRR